MNGPIIMESNAQRVINAINNKACLPSQQIAIVLVDIRQLTPQRSLITFTYVPHSTNLATDQLTKSMKKGLCPLDWVSAPHPVEVFTNLRQNYGSQIVFVSGLLLSWWCIQSNQFTVCFVVVLQCGIVSLPCMVVSLCLESIQGLVFILVLLSCNGKKKKKTHKANIHNCFEVQSHKPHKRNIKTK